MLLVQMPPKNHRTNTHAHTQTVGVTVAHVGMALPTQHGLPVPSR